MRPRRLLLAAFIPALIILTCQNKQQSIFDTNTMPEMHTYQEGAAAVVVVDGWPDTADQVGNTAWPHREVVVVVVAAEAAEGVVEGTVGGREPALGTVAGSRPGWGSDSCGPTAAPTGRWTAAEELECFAADLLI